MKTKKSKNKLKTKKSQLFTPTGRTTFQHFWEAVILASLRQFSPNYTIGSKLQAFPDSLGIQSPLGFHHSCQSYMYFYFLNHRDVYPIFEILWRAFFPFYCILSIDSMCVSSRIEWPQNNFKSHSDMLPILQISGDCSVSPPCHGS